MQISASQYNSGHGENPDRPVGRGTVSKTLRKCNKRQTLPVPTGSFSGRKSKGINYICDPEEFVIDVHVDMQLSSLLTKKVVMSCINWKTVVAIMLQTI